MAPRLYESQHYKRQKIPFRMLDIGTGHMLQRQARILVIILQTEGRQHDNFSIKIFGRSGEDWKLSGLLQQYRVGLETNPTGTISAQPLSHCCFDTSSEEDCGTTSDLSCSLLLDGVYVECCHLKHRVDPSSTLNLGFSGAPSLPLLYSILCSPLSSTGFSLFLNVASSYLFL